MTIRIVRLGTPRDPHEGARIGAVRRPPRGVRKERYAAEDWLSIYAEHLDGHARQIEANVTAWRGTRGRAT